MSLKRERGLSGQTTVMYHGRRWSRKREMVGGLQAAGSLHGTVLAHGGHALYLAQGSATESQPWRTG